MSIVSIIRNIRHWGIDPAMPDQERRTVQLSNLISLLIFTLSLLLGCALWLTVGWRPWGLYTFINAFSYLTFLLLNRYGFTVMSRLGISILLPLFTLTVAVLGKITEQEIPGFTIAELEYVHSRLVVLVSAIVPLVLFSIQRHPNKLTIALLPSFLCLVFYDAAHNLFGVGYYQTGHSSEFYSFTRILFPVMYILMAVSFLYYKQLLERTEANLIESNEKSARLYKELHTQNEQLQAQHEEIIDSQERLHEANKIIEDQKQALEDENRSLNKHLVEKNELLEETNRQLQQRLEEVRQFSYTISHNLRGPVASLLGLFSLFNKKKAYPENLMLIKHAKTTANALDTVIQDLSKVLQMRDGLRKSELIYLPRLLDAVMASLQEELNKKEGRIYSNLEAEELYAEKAYLHSILYNLISNAVKYASPERPPEIKISSKKLKNSVQLIVSDNGRGIDLDQNEQYLFKLYKRFHLGEEGRGLGLYLVKAQTEALGGEVKIESVVNEGSSFYIFLPQNNR